MIGWMQGKLLSVTDQEAMLNVAGVGYCLQIGPNQARELSGLIGESVERFVYTLVREDALKLFGFDGPEKRELFAKLLSVSGVGPKAALSIMDLFEPDQLVSCVALEDERAFQQVPGIGKKTAQRLLIDLKDKLKNQVATQPHSKKATGSPERVLLLEARSALVNLGFIEKEADKVIHKHLDSQIGLDELIRLCLLELKKN